LPLRLNANDTSLRIASVGNIQEEVIKMSPMVGNGPSTGHMLCMLQYEVGTRTANPICLTAQKGRCYPPLSDPCNPAELTRCGCESRVDEVFPITMQGFNLQQEDALHFIPYDDYCEWHKVGPHILSPFDAPTSQEVAEDRGAITYHGIAAMSTGTYRMCATHVDRLYDVGFVTVRPACQVPLVLVDGACVEHCPRTRIPIAGNCLRDRESLMAEDTQAWMVPIKMNDPYAGSSGPFLARRPSDDPEQRYFIYRYRYELAKILNADPTRIKVASLNTFPDGCEDVAQSEEADCPIVVVNTVFKIVGTREDILATDERSPYGLISLLNSTQLDTSSQLYQSTFFKYIDRNPLPPPMKVRECTDGTFRVFCPYTGGIMSTGESVGWFTLGILAMPVAMAILCMGLWNIDMDKTSEIDEDLIEKIRNDPSQVEPRLQIEYAQSWLEGRFMGEEWERHRKIIEPHI